MIHRCKITFEQSSWDTLDQVSWLLRHCDCLFLRSFDRKRFVFSLGNENPISFSLFPTQYDRRCSLTTVHEFRFHVTRLIFSSLISNLLSSCFVVARGRLHLSWFDALSVALNFFFLFPSNGWWRYSWTQLLFFLRKSIIEKFDFLNLPNNIRSNSGIIYTSNLFQHWISFNWH